jgi:hypothetical protein
MPLDPFDHIASPPYPPSEPTVTATTPWEPPRSSRTHAEQRGLQHGVGNTHKPSEELEDAFMDDPSGPMGAGRQAQVLFRQLSRFPSMDHVKSEPSVSTAYAPVLDAMGRLDEREPTLAMLLMEVCWLLASVLLSLSPLCLIRVWAYVLLTGQIRMLRDEVQELKAAVRPQSHVA